jgi:hypothetical protein
MTFKIKCLILKISKNLKLLYCSFKTLVVCPTWKRAVAWGLREMGSVWGKGVRAGPDRQKKGKINSQCPAKAGTTWERTRRNNQI